MTFWVVKTVKKLGILRMGPLLNGVMLVGRLVESVGTVISFTLLWGVVVRHWVSVGILSTIVGAWG